MIQEEMNDIYENYVELSRRSHNKNKINTYRNIVVNADSSAIKNEIKEWCELKHLTFIFLDALDLIEISIIGGKDRNDKYIRYNFKSSNKNISIKEFVNKFSKNIDLESIVIRECIVTAKTIINKSEFDSSDYIDLDKVPNNYYLTVNGQIEHFSSLIENKLQEQCVVFVDNLFCLDDNDISKIYNYFTNTHDIYKHILDTNNIIAFISNTSDINCPSRYIIDKNYFYIIKGNIEKK